MRNASPRIVSSYIHQFIIKIRSRELFKHSHILVCPEAAPADSADHVQHYLENVSNLTVCKEGNARGTRYGINPTAERLKSLYVQTRYILSMDVYKCYKFCIFDSNYEDVKGYCQDGFKSYHEMLLTKMLKEQMNNVIYDEDDLANKHGKKNDLLMAFMWAPLALEVVRHSERSDGYYSHIDFTKDFETELILSSDKTKEVYPRVNRLKDIEEYQKREEIRLKQLVNKTEMLKTVKLNKNKSNFAENADVFNAEDPEDDYPRESSSNTCLRCNKNSKNGRCACI